MKVHIRLSRCEVYAAQELAPAKMGESSRGSVGGLSRARAAAGLWPESRQLQWMENLLGARFATVPRCQVSSL